MNELRGFIKKKRIAIYNLERDDLELFYDATSKDKFSFSIKKEQCKKISASRFVLIKGETNLYLSWFKRKTSSTTLENGIHLNHIIELDFNFKKLQDDLSPDVRDKIEVSLRNKFSLLTQKSSLEFFENLSESIKKKMKDIISENNSSSQSVMQLDAIKFAMNIANIDRSFSCYIELKDDSDSMLEQIGAKLREDNIIAFDVYEPSFSQDKELIKYPEQGTGIVKFKNDLEELSIYTTNRMPLEEVLGVDLIYINHIHKNIVMVQYKMLEKESKGWVFRCNSHFEEQVRKMNDLLSYLSKNHDSSYRLNPNPFFLRFIKRNQINNDIVSFVISLEHYQEMESSSIMNVSNSENKKISYEMMNKHYIGKQEMEGLIRGGYIGTYASDTEIIQKVIELGDHSENAFVIAFHRKITEI